MATYYGYNAVFGTQTTVNGAAVDYAYQPPAGGAWTYSGDQTWFHVREASNGTAGHQFNGDGDSGTASNEIIPNATRFGHNQEQLAYVNGQYYQTIWDYTFNVTGADGTVYRVGVIDIDFNSNNQIDLTGGENGYFLVFPDGVPPPGGTYTVGASIDNSTSTPHSTLDAMVVCFAAGTRIATPGGEVPIEHLHPGDLVLTHDHGPQPLVWTGHRRVFARGALSPITFAAGVLGNQRALTVSPQHRMLVTGWRAELMFGEPSVLVRAKDLVDGDRVRRRAWRRHQLSPHHVRDPRDRHGRRRAVGKLPARGAGAGGAGARGGGGTAAAVPRSRRRRPAGPGAALGAAIAERVRGRLPGRLTGPAGRPGRAPGDHPEKSSAAAADGFRPG